MAEASRLIDQLIARKEYAALQALRPEFNLFGLLDDALREPAWSRLFSGVLDSTLPHALGNRGLREWLAHVGDELGKKGKQLPVAFQQVASDSIIRSTIEYITPKKRRVDVLVRILNAKHRVTAVVGIENKLNSPVRPSRCRVIRRQISTAPGCMPEAYAAFQKLQDENRDFLAVGDQKTGVIGEFFGRLYARSIYPSARAVYAADPSQTGWDLEEPGDDSGQTSRSK